MSTAPWPCADANAAAPSAGTGFNSVRHSYCSVVEALQRLDQEPTRVLLKRPENHDPQFRELLQAPASLTL